MVRVTGLEPVRLSTHAPQTCLSTCSRTLAFLLQGQPAEVIIAISPLFVNYYFRRTAVFFRPAPAGPGTAPFGGPPLAEHPVLWYTMPTAEP